jgi:hypothetical protein
MDLIDGGLDELEEVGLSDVLLHCSLLVVLLNVLL